MLKKPHTWYGTASLMEMFILAMPLLLLMMLTIAPPSLDFAGVQFVGYLNLTYFTWECHYDDEDSLSLLEDQNVLPVSGRSAQRPRLVNGS